MSRALSDRSVSLGRLSQEKAITKCSGSQVRSGSPHRGSACVALGEEWSRAAGVSWRKGRH